MKKRTGRIWVFGAILLVVFALYAWAAVTPYVGEVTTTTTTSTSFTTVFDSSVTQLDSLAIVGFIGAATDTTWFAYVDTAAVDTTITGLTPGETYIIYAYGRGTGATAISAPDTITLYQPQMGDWGRYAFMNRKLATAATWPNGGVRDYTFDLDMIGAIDSTLVYYSATYNGIDILAEQAGDSCVATLYAIPVQWSGTWNNTDTWMSQVLPADSVQVTDSGLFRTSLSLPAGKLYMFRIQSMTGNGKDADYTLTLTGDGHN